MPDVAKDTGGQSVTPPKPKSKKLLMTGVALLFGTLCSIGGIYLMKPEWLNAGPAHAAPEKPAVIEMQYVQFEQGFTANLKDSDQFVQLNIAFGINGDEKSGELIKYNETALRAATLTVIGDQNAETMAGAAGRKILTNNIKLAVNAALKDQSVPVRVDRVYLTSFVIQ